MFKNLRLVVSTNNLRLRGELDGKSDATKTHLSFNMLKDKCEK